MSRSFALSHSLHINPRKYRPKQNCCLTGIIAIFIIGCIALSALESTESYAVSKIEAKTLTSHSVAPHMVKKALVHVTTYRDYGKMANGKITHEGAAACSRAWKFGTQFILEGVTYTCEDRYNKRLETSRSLPTVDLFHSWDYQKSKAFGSEIKEITFK